MAQHEMTHPTYGTRVVDVARVEKYERVGWTRSGEVVPDVVAESMKAVLERVGNDPALAHEALAAEQSRTSPRPKLVASLLQVIDTPDTTSEV